MTMQTILLKEIFKEKFKSFIKYTYEAKELLEARYGNSVRSYDINNQTKIRTTGLIKS